MDYATPSIRPSEVPIPRRLFLVGCALNLLASGGLHWAGHDLRNALLVGWVSNSLFWMIALVRWRMLGGWTGVVSNCLVVLAALCLSAGVLAAYADAWPTLEYSALWGAAVTCSATLFFGGRLLTTSLNTSAERFSGARDVSSIAYLVLFTVALRLVYSCSITLLPEEAYYWKYAENLSYGYLDHPPAVAFLIAIGTFLFGTTEFGVRAGAGLCWLFAAGIMFQLASELFDRRVAWGTLLLVAVLPFFSGIGLFVTPDSPLVLFWSLSLYGLHRALLRKDARAWYLVGFSIGFGMLSKYTTVLLGPAIVAFLLLDPHSREWFRRKEPYLAALIALVIFSPVLVWNAEHEWASFLFQGPRRLAEGTSFYTPRLFLDLLLLLSPAGLVSAAILFLPRNLREKYAIAAPFECNQRVRLFSAVFAGVPLAIFALLSVRQEFKFNWTGPVLLAVTPFIAQGLVHSTKSGWIGHLRSAWAGFLAVYLLVPGMVFLYLTLGLPGVGYPKGFRKFVSIRELSREVSGRIDAIRSDTGRAPIFVGADKHYLASQIGFYRAKDAYRRGLAPPERTQGRSLFGEYALMYHFWSTPLANVGRDMMLVSATRSDLDEKLLNAYFDKLGPIEEIVTRKENSEVGRYYLRIGYRYRPARQAL